ncbi:MAG: S49 family peptidase [Alphaproteobacteria bacterium]|nr:S49 family peptidase [Alphaproteobacteria bacterium]MBU0795846.1 S49 family peptidase [Alphaproteobacteria bacterium]MBU0885746.1 S49 family peptidase [Alphaproteobacteria bacterium]MBU1814449.1 S49 family peptidase [Alphaproteobacteria bacterium]MBU2091358.1 S49 family peptidase [Alphaproteobacteria bacterium]
MPKTTFFSRLLRPLLKRRDPIVPVVRLSGVIGQVGPMRAGLTISLVAPLLERAFSIRKAKAVAIIVNSPGGSPVQSSLIYKRIRDLASEHDRKVLVFVEDAAASGGYWLACAGDEIFVDHSSIVGSIGVVSAGFGFVELIEKIGVERRLYATGANKGMLDPFTPEDPAQVEKLRQIQNDMLATFKALVRNRRDGRLTTPDEVLFDGSFWAGTRAVELGLADSVGELRSVLRARFGDKVRMPMISARRSLLSFWGPQSGMSGGGRIEEAVGAALDRMPDAVLAAAEERALWARYGL